MKRMETSPEKEAATEKLLQRIGASGLDNAKIARLARLATSAVRHVRLRISVPRWATIDKINRGLNRWEAKAKE